MSTVADLPPSAQILVGPSGASQFEVTDAGKRWRISWKVAWEEAQQFLQVVKGYPEQIGAIVRTIPLQCPYDATLYAVAIRGQGRGSDTAISASRPHPWMHFAVDFATLPYGVDGDSAFIELSHAGSIRQVTVPGHYYTYASTGGKIEQGVGVPIGGVGIQLTIYQLPSLLAFMSAVTPLTGKVNSLPFTAAGITYAAGTVFFETFSTKTQKTVMGMEQHQAELSLLYSALEWNKVIAPDGNPDDISPAPFGVADLNALIM